MAGVKVLIVEDDFLLQEQLSTKLKELGLKVSDRLERGEDVLASIQSERPDVIIMDIHLAGNQNGIATSKQVNEQYDIPIIYLTDHIDDDTFDKAKLTTPANFLPKPYNIVNLERAIELAFQNTARPVDFENSATKNESYLFGNSLFIKSNYQWEKIKVDDVVLLEAGRSYSYLFTDTNKYLFTESMKKLASQLPEGIFLRISRSHVVNVNRIYKVKDDVLFIHRNGKELSIKIGATYRKKFYDQLPKIQ